MTIWKFLTLLNSINSFQTGKNLSIFQTNFQNPYSIHFLNIFYILTFDIFLFIRMEMVVIDDMGVKAFEKFLPMSRVNINPEIKLAECVRLAKDKDGNLVTIIL